MGSNRFLADAERCESGWIPASTASAGRGRAGIPETPAAAAAGPLFAAPFLSFETGGEPFFVVDLNGDGKPDLAVRNSSAVSVLLWNGDGTFGPKSDYATGSGTGPQAIVDLNGDGKPDLVTANGGSNTVSVLLGNGDGTFGPKSDYATGSGLLFLAVGDLNGDGKA